MDGSMSLFGRPDGVRAERVEIVRRFMPFLMRRRNESAVWFRSTSPAGRFLDYFISCRSCRRA